MEALDIIQANIYACGLLRVKPQMTPNSKERQGTTERSECRRMEESSLNGGACAIVASAHAHSSYGRMEVRVERKYRMAPMGFRTSRLPYSRHVSRGRACNVQPHPTTTIL